MLPEPFNHGWGVRPKSVTSIATPACRTTPEIDDDGAVVEVEETVETRFRSQSFRERRRRRAAGSTWTAPAAGTSTSPAPSCPSRTTARPRADEIELLVNGRSPGVSPVGGQRAFVATLVTAAGAVLLHLESETGAIGCTDDDLAFVRIDLVDRAGTLNPSQQRLVRVAVDGPGVLQGLGSGDPKPDELLVGAQRSTYNGRLLAVIRPTGGRD